MVNYYKLAVKKNSTDSLEFDVSGWKKSLQINKSQEEIAREEGTQTMGPTGGLTKEAPRVSVF
jgi:hypothetical protein